MKKLYKTITTVVLAAMCTFQLSAQMNGAYTINQTIAASSSNFISFTAFSASLASSGISGPVTVNVVTGTGPYNEQVTFNQYTGSSSVNTITINGNGNTITFPGTTGAPHTILLGGADYMFFNNLTVVGTGAAGQALHLYNNSDNNQFIGCVFTLPANLTTTNMYPVSLSGSATTVLSSGSGGNNNVWNGCTMNSGRYSVVFYGAGNTGNQVINCNILDYYGRGIYHYNCAGTIIRGNLFERLNRTTVTTTYAIFIDYSPGASIVVERNQIRRQFAGALSSTNQFMGIANYNYGAGSGTEGIFRNNVISNISFNGSFYGYYNPGYAYDVVIHNSIIMDDVASTGGSCYGIMSYAASPSIVRNNLVSCNRSGSGNKYCMYFGNSSITSNNNILWQNSSAGNNNLCYYNADFANLTAWKNANGGAWDQSSMSADPLFANSGIFDYTPTVPALNNIGLPLGVATDVNGLARNLPAPDAGAFEFFNTQCTGTPGANTVLTPTYVVCPSELNSLMLASGYTVNGISFQWQISPNNPLGPYTAVSGATLASLTQTLANSAWFNVSLFCVNGGNTITAAAGQVTVATTTTNTPPYFEGFEGIQGPEKLPNCSWSLSNAGRAHTAVGPMFWMTARTGGNFAYHGTNNNGYGTPQYHYTNGIQLTAGVTYSASVWYVTPGYSTVSDFQLAYGTTQSPTGLTTIATVVSPGANQYTALTNTFTVLNSGLYYIAVKTTDNYSYDFFAWDDLSITIPCQLSPNQANLSVTGPTVVCSGKPASLMASGVNSYTWVSGPNTPAYTPIVNTTTVYTAIGMNTLSGCTSTVAKPIVANPLPAMTILSTVTEICQGSSVTLYAIGAGSYSWSSGVNGQQAIVMPNTTTSYTVLGSNAYGCVGSAQQMITVNPLPVISVLGNTVICEGERMNLAGTGAVTYTWSSPSFYVIGSPVSITPPMGSMAYMVSGTDANGCVGTSNRAVLVEACTGIGSNNIAANKLMVYPNPNNGVFNVTLANGINKSFDVIDVTGRVVLTGATSNNQFEVNISNLSNGVYYVKVTSDKTVEVVKVVKQ
jgi:hypothetical protein